MASTNGTATSVWRIPELLAMKRDGSEYSEEQITQLMNSVANGTLDECQLGALLMAIYLKGMTDRETTALTKAMRDSGSVFSWPKDWRLVDKHSTGGVGDKISLALAPALAACGLKVPMISGRGLGHTGGTLDKLESIPGLKVHFTEEEMHQTLEEVGCCIVGQTSNIVPADRRMYAVRDVTSTVDSVPLIVSSIISKKAAESVTSLVLDIKFGAGAFMETQTAAKNLARKLVDVAKFVGMATTALLTSMDAPIGRAIGNALEVRDALDCLRGEGPHDLEELVTRLGGELMEASGSAKTAEEGCQLIHKSLRDGSARKVFCKMIQKQGVARDVAEALCADIPDFSHLPHAVHVTPVAASTTGVLVSMDAMTLGRISLGLGAGRSKGGDPIDYSVGIMLLKVVGESVKEGETWAELHHNHPVDDTLIERMQGAIAIDAERQPFRAVRVAERVS